MKREREIERETRLSAVSSPLPMKSGARVQQADLGGGAEMRRSKNNFKAADASQNQME